MAGIEYENAAYKVGMSLSVRGGNSCVVVEVSFYRKSNDKRACQRPKSRWSPPPMATHNLIEDTSILPVSWVEIKYLMKNVVGLWGEGALFKEGSSSISVRDLNRKQDLNQDQEHALDQFTPKKNAAVRATYW
ncbi:hypothetical protein EVAR_57197_1 [Eumeta japonica]|uniref:Uncharacterized protein n=1 Tax=Eumeta variegata TaxID=151549 RepID=A0A4C1YWU5_EUMVA|nr:hypothetical protein EVAR_57197_1 [Eumeta japonica]